VPHLRGADAVVLLAWLKQPSRDLNKLWMNNVQGSMRAAGAVKEAGVPVLLYASSIGTYSPAPKNRAVDSIPTLYYSRQKAEAERRLNHFESQNPDIRVVRFRPAPAFKRESAEGLRRLFGEPFFRVSWHGRGSSTSSRRSKVCVSRSSTPTMWEKHTGSPSCTTCMARSTSPPIRC
jgi:nucleoside-diphosphate-sugar epimerase